jgi:hypothetical protein
MRYLKSLVDNEVSLHQKHMEVCVEKLSEGSVSMVMKFSENYGCVL